MDFTGSVSGSAELIFLSEEALKFVQLITGDAGAEHDFDELKTATFSEVGNIVINAVIGTLSNELSLKLDFAIPSYIEGSAGKLVSVLGDSPESVILYARVLFYIEEIELEGSIVIFFNVRSFETLLAAVDSYV